MQGVLIGAHHLLAEFTKEDALELAPQEAEALTKAFEKVARHYDIKMTQKALDWSALMMTAGGIYGPRLAVIGLKRKLKQSADATQAGNVRPFGVVHNGSGIPG